jgi:hypothetical protein
VAQRTGVVDAALDLLRYGQRELDRHGRNGADDHLADRGVELRSGDALAERIAEQATEADAHVARRASLHSLGTRARTRSDARATVSSSTVKLVARSCRPASGSLFSTMQGRVVCGRCGSHMHVRYCIRSDQRFPHVHCRDWVNRCGGTAQSRRAARLNRRHPPCGGAVTTQPEDVHEARALWQFSETTLEILKQQLLSESRFVLSSLDLGGQLFGELAHQLAEGSA